MARIAEEEIERLKGEVSLARLVEARGIELKRHGADLLGLCPFHEDHEPSLIVSPKKNLWHCLGACQTGGSVVDWVMKAQGVSFRHAVELLRADHPSLTTAAAPVRQSTVHKLAPPIDRDADDEKLLVQVVGFYHDTLKQSPDALAYLKKRGLEDPEIVERFRLGFADRTLGLRLPPKNRQAGAEMRGRLQKLGILRAESGHEHMNGSVVFPIIDLDGDVLGMYGRKITAGLREGTPLHLYLPGPHRGVWNEEALIASKEIILCESIIDALTFWCAGFRNVTASYGVNGFTDDHRAALKKHGIERIKIAYDRDEAGEKAAASLADELMAMGIECHRVLFPHGMDANEYALKVTPAAKSLRLLLNQAQWLGKGKPPEKDTIEIVSEELASASAPSPKASEEPAAKEKGGPPPVSETDLSLAAEPVFPLAAAAVAREETPAEVEVRAQEIVITRGDRRYRVRGFAKNTSYDLLKINLLAGRGDGFHVDTFNLYAAHQCAAFVKQAALEMGVSQEAVKGDLQYILGKLEAMQEEQIRAALEPKPKEIAMSEEDRTAALALLKDPKLLDRIAADFERCGLVGEETNKLVGYLAAVSRRLESPLAVVVQSSSAAGKSSLMDAVLQFVPEEERVQYSAMTGQALFYMGELDLKHKVLAIVEEEGASRAAYALKLLQSEGSLSIASTGKDPATGKLVTHEYRVEGPVMIFLTTTAIDIDEELLNRCLVLAVNEDRAQTQAIHKLQREQQTLEGLIGRQKRRDTIRLHQNAQRLLQPLCVVNPFVEQLTFPDKLTRMRRDHMKYLTLIRAIALLHQHQRPVKNAPGFSYIEAAREDIETAGRLMEELMRRSLDELPAQTRRLLGLIEEMVDSERRRLKMERGDFRFSRKDVRAWTEWGDTVLKKHLGRLEDMEYLLVHSGGRGQSFVYELVPGPIYEYDKKKSPLEEEKSPLSRPQVAGVSRGGRPYETRMNTGANGVFARKPPNGTDTGVNENPVVAVTMGGR
jgi:DNA primase catalytic core